MIDMRYKILFVAAIAGLLSATCQDVLAQQTKRVEVTSIFLPDVAPAKKIMAPTEINDAPVIDPEIHYSVEPETWQIALDSHNYSPAIASFWDMDRSKHFFLKIGAGYPFNTDGAFRYTLQNKRVGFMSVGVDHLGDLMARQNVEGLSRDIAHSYTLRNRASVAGGVFVGRYLFEARSAYDYDIYNRYAELVETPARLDFHDVDVALRFGDDFADLSYLNFSVEAHGGLWAHKLPLSTDNSSLANEFRAGGSVRVARDIYDNEITIDAGYDMWSATDVLYRDTRFDVGVGYRRKFGIVDVDAGVAYMYDKVKARDKASHFVMPRAKILVDLQKTAFAPYVELTTTVSQNGVMSLYDTNPFIDWGYMQSRMAGMPNTRSYNLSAGFSGSAISSRLAYRAYVGADFMRNTLYWFVTRTGLFGVDAGGNNRLFFGLEVEYKPLSGLAIDLGVNAHVDSNDMPYVISESKFKADAEISYILKRWKFYVSADVLGRRQWSGEKDAEGKAPIVFSMPTKVDLGAGVCFRASQRVEVYVDGHNLLNSKIYDWANYYSQGAGFTAGVKLNF